jgi:hypothetical protein
MRGVLLRTVLGVVLGIMGGGLALMIAIGRASLVGSGGRGPALVIEHQETLAPAFLVGFGLGGALLGLLAPLRRTAVGALGLSFIAATGFVVAVFVGIAGPPAAWSASSWWAVGTATVLLSILLAGQVQPSN